MTPPTQQTSKELVPDVPVQEKPVSKEPTQSVFVADQDVVKNYPISKSNDEINFDLHTTVRKNKPEDYYVNFMPMTEVQKAFQFIEVHGENLGEAIKDLTPPVIPALQGVKIALDAESKYIDPAIKYAVADPLAAIGFSQEVNPQAVADAYKPWLQLWRESPAGGGMTSVSDKSLANAPLAIAAIPWFVSEFIPEQLLETGTKASAWLGMYGIEKFGPPAINAFLKATNLDKRVGLLGEAVKIEKGLADDFETLGISPNTRMSDVKKAFDQAAFYTHPDLGGDPQEFIKVKNAYENIRKSRSGFIDKIFDSFRRTNQARMIKGLLESQKGAAMIPSKGDLAKVGKDFVKVLNITGELATVNLAGKIMDVPLSSVMPVPKVKMNENSITKEKNIIEKAGGKKVAPFVNGKIGPNDLIQFDIKEGTLVMKRGDITPENVKTKIDTKKKAFSQSAELNTDKLKLNKKEKSNLQTGLEEATAKIEGITGKPLTNEEVIDAAKKAKVIDGFASRERTLAFEAEMLRSRQHMAALAQGNDVSEEFLNTIAKVKSHSTEMGRQLQSLSIKAIPEIYNTKVEILNDLIKLGHTVDDLVKAAKGVDFTNQNELTEFYRKFVKPTWPEILDEWVYINILSSPLTHIKNLFSNAIQMAGLNPAHKLASGAIDFVKSNLTGAERERYVSEIPAFYKGALNALPKGLNLALEALKGNRPTQRPDLKHLPTLSKAVDWGTLKVGKYIPRALEASDVLFRTMVQAGEEEALASKLGHPPDEKELENIKEEAQKKAEYYVFRAEIDPSNKTGQGHLLSYIDKMTSWITTGRRTVPGMKWFVRFVETPMNIFKQGIENSPLGFANMWGSKDKADTAGKAMVGSLVFAGGAWLAGNDLTTWAAPKGAREKEAFDKAGLLPYSIIIGDHAVSFSQIGPLAYPLAMASALHYFSKEHADALTDSQIQKVTNSLMGIMGFFSDQSYMQGLNDLVKAASGEQSRAISSVPTQLIPLSSLQGWVNNVLDPLQRNAGKKLSFDSVLRNIEMKVIGMAQNVPAKIDSEEVPVKKQMRFINAISPLRISKINKSALADYREIIQDKQESNQAKKEAQ